MGIEIIHMEGEVSGDFYKAEDIEELKSEYLRTEKELSELKIIAANRKNFIDWCADHHEEILKEYTGFAELEK